jgi:hypothetical protein
VGKKDDKKARDDANRKLVKESFERNKSEDDHDSREAEKRLRKAIEDER